MPPRILARANERQLLKSIFQPAVKSSVSNTALLDMSTSLQSRDRSPRAPYLSSKRRTSAFLHHHRHVVFIHTLYMVKASPTL